MKNYFLIITVLLHTSYFSSNLALPSSIKVAAIFDREGDEKHALAFTAAIDYINDIDNWRLPGIILEPVVIKIPYDDRYDLKSQELNSDTLPLKNRSIFKFLAKSIMIYFSYAAEEAVCNLLLKGNVMAIFGPQSDSSAEHIKSITDSKEIPFIDTR